MENIAKKKSVENHVYSVLSRYKKKSGLFLHLRYKTEYERREKGRDHDKEVLKPRFQAGTESIWRPQISTESKDDSCSSSPSDQSFQNEKIIIPLLKKQNYLEVEQCSNEWRALRVGTITASKVPSLLGFNGVKEFDNGWFAIKNRIDEHVLNPKRSKLPNFIRGKQQEQNAIQQFQNDSKMGVSQCGYFKHPSDSRFGASPDGVSTGRQQFLVEIKTRSLPNNTQLEKLNEEEKNKKMEIALKPLPHITGAHLCQCHLQMECTQTDLTYLMSYVPETKVATYFPVQKNHILCEIMMEILIHIYENKSFQDPWAHFEHPHLKKLGNQLVGSVPSFENTHHFRSWVNSVAKSTPCISF